jgi:hypothetical protein
MRMNIKSAVLALALSLVATSAIADDLEPLIGESRAAIKGFGMSLKGELVAAMEAGGPINAIGVCNIVAPGIAAERSIAYAGRVGRTSLKRRNPANAPDWWEADVLASFEARKAAGEDVKSLDYAEIVVENGSRIFRYMKAISTAPVCTKCHGTEIAPEVVAVLDETYPSDMARGFAVGDIRGAFTLRKVLD